MSHSHRPIFTARILAFMLALFSLTLGARAQEDTSPKAGGEI